jgi:hypothetical protein
MHPLFADPRRLVGYLAAWLIVGAGLAALLQMMDLADWSGALLLMEPVSLVYGFVALSAYYVCRSQPVSGRRWPIVILVFGGASTLSALAWLGLAQLWNGVRSLGGQDDPLVAMTGHAWVLFFATGFALYLLSILAHDVLVAFQAVHETAAREAESRVLARDAELRLLRTQIDPHFLFNSLNSISALTTLDPAAARDMAIDLAQFFRRTLALAERERIPLADEMALCESFLAIERRRFGTKLRTALRIDPTAAPALMPPMTLQPLLENAIKHGIRSLDDGGTVEVEALVRDGWLHVAVANPVATESGEAAARPPGHGLGLRNLRERLAVLYGDRARLTWRRAEARFEIEITLPLETAST